MNPIIPKKLGSQKLKIKGNITIVDFIAEIIFILIVVGIVFPLTIIGTTAQVVLGISILLILNILLLPNKKAGLRTYELIFLMFKFKSSKKVFSFESDDSNTDLLIPYEKLVDFEGEDLGILKTKKLLNNVNFFVSAVEIEGFNILNQSYESQQIKIETLQALWKNLDVNVSLVKLEKKFDKITSSSFLNRKINDLKKMRLTKSQLEPRIAQLKANINNFEVGGILGKENFQHKYYLFIYATNENEAKEVVNYVIQKGTSSGLTISKLDRYELINSIRFILDPLGEEFTNDLIDGKATKINELLQFETCKFEKQCFHSNEMYYSVNSIREYPKFPSRTWMLPLMANDSTVIMNIAPLKKKNVEKKLQATLMNLKSNRLTIANREIVGQRELDAEISFYENVADRIGIGSERMKSMNFVLLNYGWTAKDLEERNKQLNLQLKDFDFVIDNLIYRQFEGFSSVLPKPTDPLSNVFGRDVPSITLSEGFPFLTSDLVDGDGIFIGENLFGSPVILDQFKLTKVRKNHNMLMLGTSGSGKSTFAKLLISNHLNLGRKVIIVDPEREYKNLCNYYSGNWIDVGNGTTGRINPLQIFTTLEDSTTPDNKAIVSNHISFLGGWFEILFPDVDKNIVRCFTSSVASLYSNLAFNNDNITALEANKYPKIDDLIEYIKKIKNLNLNESELEQLLSLLQSEFQGYGQYSKLYNGHSTIKKSSNPFVVFDINTLFEKGQQNIIQAQLYLITAFISNEVNDNFVNDDKQIVVLIDEAHLLIDKDKPIALNFIFQMIKRIRKRRGSMTLITQNPDDFLGSEDVKKKTMAMINNVQYTAILNLSSNNVDDIAELYKNYGEGLSQEEIHFIATAEKGTCLFMTNGYDRHTIQIKVSREQFKAFENERN